MNYERGLEALKKVARGTEWYLDFIALEAALLDKLDYERRYGYAAETHQELLHIVDHLNRLAIQRLGISFNDLCQDRQSQDNYPQHLPQAIQTGQQDPAPGMLGQGKRWAVLVGVNTYEDAASYGPLHVCVKDVEALHAQLMAGGFAQGHVHVLTDTRPGALPTRNNILATLASVARNTELDDLLLFYFSGHGDEEGRKSYLIPRDGRALALKDTAVPVSRVIEIIQKAPARAKVIILDACHAGANIGHKSPKSMSASFMRHVFEQAQGLVVLASCEKGQLSHELLAQERSVFTHFFLEALRGKADDESKGFVTVQDTHRYVSYYVKSWASHRMVAQTPTLEASVEGDIILCYYLRP